MAPNARGLMVIAIVSLPTIAQDVPADGGAPLSSNPSDAFGASRKPITREDRTRALKLQEESKKREDEEKQRLQSEEKARAADAGLAKQKAETEAKEKEALEEAKRKELENSARRARSQESEVKRLQDDERRQKEEAKALAAERRKLEEEERRFAEERRKEEALDKVRQAAAERAAKLSLERDELKRRRADLEEQRKALAEARKAREEGHSFRMPLFKKVMPASSQEEAQKDPKFVATTLPDGTKLKVLSTADKYPFFSIPSSGCPTGKTFVIGSTLAPFDGFEPNSVLVLSVEEKQPVPSPGTEMSSGTLRRAGKAPDGTFVYCRISEPPVRR